MHDLVKAELDEESHLFRDAHCTFFCMWLAVFADLFSVDGGGREPRAGEDRRTLISDRHRLLDKEVENDSTLTLVDVSQQMREWRA